MTSAITATGLRKSFGGKIILDGVDLEIGIAEGTAARLEVSTGHGHVHNLLENAIRPEEAGQTVEVRGHTSYGDITIRRSRLASGTGEEGQP